MFPLRDSANLFILADFSRSEVNFHMCPSTTDSHLLFLLLSLHFIPFHQFIPAYITKYPRQQPSLTLSHGKAYYAHRK